MKSIWCEEIGRWVNPCDVSDMIETLQHMNIVAASLRSENAELLDVIETSKEAPDAD